VRTEGPVLGGVWLLLGSETWDDLPLSGRDPARDLFGPCTSLCARIIGAGRWIGMEADCGEAGADDGVSAPRGDPEGVRGDVCVDSEGPPDDKDRPPV
jgi:hypothetical protein